MKEKDYLVRIQCTTFNHASYIEDAMNGFCIQKTTFPFVVVIIDDASTDGEPEVIRHYLGEHFDMQNAKLWDDDDAYFIETRHQENQNCTFVVILLKYNFYHKKAKGPLFKTWSNTKYVAICEGDDYWTAPYKLQKQVDFLEHNPEFVLCTHDFYTYLENEKTFAQNSEYCDLFKNKSDFVFSLDNYFDGWFTFPLTCLYRNISHLRIPGQRYKYYRDDIFFYYLLREGKGMLLQDIMGVYRMHGGGSWSHLSELDKKWSEIYNAYNIYCVEKDKRAIRKIERAENRRIMLLEKNTNFWGMMKELTLFYKVSPLLTFLKVSIRVIRTQIGLLHYRLVS